MKNPTKLNADLRAAQAHIKDLTTQNYKLKTQQNRETIAIETAADLANIARALAQMVERLSHRLSELITKEPKP